MYSYTGKNNLRTFSASFYFLEFSKSCIVIIVQCKTYVSKFTFRHDILLYITNVQPLSNTRYSQILSRMKTRKRREEQHVLILCVTRQLDLMAFGSLLAQVKRKRFSVTFVAAYRRLKHIGQLTLTHATMMCPLACMYLCVYFKTT